MLKIITFFTIWFITMLLLTEWAMELISTSDTVLNLLGIMLFIGSWMAFLKLSQIFINKFKK